MNERIQKLRRQSLEAKPYISPERAILITEFYKSGKPDGQSAPMRRALAFKYLMENKTICINDGELIVGERGEAPKATPTYPELTVHSLRDLNIIKNREKIPFAVDDNTFEVYENEVIPFWKGKSMRDRIFLAMEEDWKEAYECGMFTEFMEQRAPGHTVSDEKIYKKGFLDLKEDIKKSIESLDFYNDPEAYYKAEELKAIGIVADSLIHFAHRHAEKAREMAEKEIDPVRKKELERVAEICSNVPARAPEDFQEAMQYYWFVHLGVITELNTWDSFCPGRLDQHLLPFYQKGLEVGGLTQEKAKELLCAFWIKFNNQPAPPKVGITAEESNTYTDFSLINVGGVREDGSNAVNELSYLILDVIEEMRLLQPSSMVQLSKKNPDRFLKRALKIIRTGFGQPSIFNTEALIQEMLGQGKSLIDARNGGASGCVETGAFGKESYILTGYFNLVKVMEMTLNNGVDPITGREIGIKTGDPREFNDFNAFFEAFEKQLQYFIDVKIKGSNIIERLYAEYMPAPFLSLIIDDCIQKGKDYHNGGSRYNTSYIQGVGLGSITDSMTSINYNIFENQILSMEEMLKILKDNFENHEIMRQRFINKTPKFGNDDERADDVMRRIFNAYHQAVDNRKNTRAGVYRINLLPTTCHIYFGKVTQATSDGRLRGEALSEGISPVQGADRHGPTAVIKSVSRIEHLRTGGTLLNQKFNPQFLASDEGLNQVANLVRSYFRMDGHHIQFNVVDVNTLKKAQKQPEKYQNLIVRVAGYSDYFVDLDDTLQNEIIRRTEHQCI
jgi:pyruvate formate-lyase/glycerol dehydratase family glycyl radical enzyme